MSSNKQKLTFKYIFTYDYNPVYVNGAHGGISPRGEIIANFYLERTPLPNELVHSINPDGTINAEAASTDPENLNSMLVRYISSGIVLNHQNAKDLHGWLGDKIAELERLMQARNDVIEQSA
ncbi:MAG: hypothetical protein HXX11_05815 [Desulfuromonadales bacterium]|nr:hypothetical protein [Desulfuromonadales bacterium]